MHPGLNRQSDQVLVARFQQSGDQQALLQLISRHRELIHGHLHRFRVDLLPEDFEQELYLVLFEKLPYAGEIQNFRAWLSTLVRNRLRDMLRKQGSRQQYQHYCEQLPQSYDPRVEHALDRSTLVNMAFAAVNENEATCLRARYFGEQSYEEVADQLGLTVKQVCGRLERGMKKMRSTLGTQPK